MNTKHPFVIERTSVINKMKLRGSRVLSLRQRVFVIAGALFCLCMSSSVGPRLLPLPNLFITSSFRLALNTAVSSAHTPGNPKEQSAHLQMSAGSQYRTRDRYQSVQVGAHAPETPLSLTASTGTYVRPVYRATNFKIPSLSVSSGRSPPKDA